MYSITETNIDRHGLEAGRWGMMGMVVVTVVVMAVDAGTVKVKYVGRSLSLIGGLWLAMMSACRKLPASSHGHWSHSTLDLPRPKPCTGKQGPTHQR